jgi:hypothetical protein
MLCGVFVCERDSALCVCVCVCVCVHGCTCMHSDGGPHGDQEGEYC